MTNPKQPFLQQFLPLALRAAYDYCNIPLKIPSKSIRLSMTLEQDAPLRGRLNVPFYWATWYHNGRGGIEKGPNDGFLVYYKDPKQDPRIKSGYPVRRSDVKRLSPYRFKQDRRAGKLIVRKSVGPTNRNFPFFSDTGGMIGFDSKLDELAKKETDSYVARKLQAAGLLNKKVSVKI